MKKLFLLALLLLSQVIVNAQSITGKIVDEHGEGLSNLELVLYSATKDYYTVTSNDGSFQFNIVTDINEENELPTGFKVSMNYPNPFNPKTRFVLELPTASNVSVDVYNVLGERVLGNITKYYSAGINYIDLELNGLSNGIYISSFKIDNKYTINRKMLLLYGSQHLTEGSVNIASSGNNTELRKTTYNLVIDSLVARSIITGSKAFTGLPTLTSVPLVLGDLIFERYCPGMPTVTYEGKTYNTVRIGEQCWLKENLDAGKKIQSTENSIDNSIMEKYCYANDSKNCDKYGGLYRWEEALQYKTSTTRVIRGVCPIGWHIPSLTEFEKLALSVNNDANALKKISQGIGTKANTSGFSASFGGIMNDNGTFTGIENLTRFWTTFNAFSNPTNIGLIINNLDIQYNTNKKLDGLSVRCINDNKYSTPSSMILVDGGTFQMGSNLGEDNEKPVHTVTLSSYYIGKYEVTQEEYEEIMGENPSEFKVSKKPVESVSWFDAVEFCNKMSEREGLEKFYNISGTTVTMNWGTKGYRLPTEAEWEYAARGGNRSTGYFYSGSNNLEEVGWYKYNSGNETHEVGKKQANELGIYDMSGNVWEWCNDWYEAYDSAPRTNPSGPESGSWRIRRGGSWYENDLNSRVAKRQGIIPGNMDGNNGFRISKPF